jgi:LPS-assembly protein
MIRPRMIPLSLLLIASFFMGLPVFAQQKVVDLKMGKDEGPVNIEADELSYKREERIYQGDGNVEVTRGDFSLRANHARLNMVTNELTAWGDVLMSEREDVMECERLEVNLESQVGRAYKAKLFLKNNNYHITGDEAEKLGENRYRVRNGSFTTCDDKRPPWKFTVKEMEITLADSGIAKGSVLYVEDIPLFYLPWGTIPLRKERQTGFLLPQIGISGENGPEVKTAFYWAMTKEMDSTVYLSYLGDRGLKEGLEYRYSFGRESNGEARFYFINDNVFNGKRDSYFFQGEQKLPEDFYLKANINRVSDRVYLRDFDSDLPQGAKIDASSTRQLRSVLFGGKDWDRFSLLAEALYFQDMELPDSPIIPKDQTMLGSGRILKELPQLSFFAHPQSLYQNLFFYDFTSSYANFARETGVTAHVVDLLPRISYPARLLDVLKFDSNIGFRETAYRADTDSGEPIKRSGSREIFDSNVSLSTEFYKVHDGTVIRWLSDLFNVDKWMHTIEPTIGYRYTPHVDQDDLPRLDDLKRSLLPERVLDANEITYGVTQRLVGKPPKQKVDSGPYEYAMLQIFQSYSFGDPYILNLHRHQVSVSPNTFITDGDRRDFSAIQGLLTWRFNPYLMIRWNAAFDPYRVAFDELNTLVRVKDKRNDAFQIDYRYSNKLTGLTPPDSGDKINTINFHTRLKTIDPLYLYGSLRYNLEDHSTVESTYGLEYQAQCWTLGFTFEDKRVGVTTSEKNGVLTFKKDTTFQIYVNLLGLGGLGDRPKFMGL